ncbi:unnamed protein product, partial [Mesorhabditis belari]|uniref:Guanylate-binding protein N-terminal domain-containing protein n=1 Tax=Mesorhabditis belari TaxID=2138241 RepID=A0AAF3J7Z3_9BILA
MSDSLHPTDWESTIDKYQQIETATIEKLQSIIPALKGLQVSLRERGKKFTIANTAANATTCGLSVLTVILTITIPLTAGATTPLALAAGVAAVGTGATSVGINIAGNIVDAHALTDEIQEVLTIPITGLSLYIERVAEQRRNEIVRLREMSNSIDYASFFGAFFHSLGRFAALGGFAARGLLEVAAKALPRLGLAAAGVVLSAAVDFVFLGINIRDLITGDTSSRANQLEKLIADVKDLIDWIREDVQRRREIYFLEEVASLMEMAQMLKLVKTKTGEPVCVDVYFNEILEKIKDMPSLVVGICGVQRTGKSFLLELLRKTILDTGILDDPKTEIGEPHSVRYFSGKKPCTQDIEIWSEPFIFQAPNGQKWAILLLDAQGLFDDRAPPEVNTFITGFLAMFCDILVYNVKQFNMNDFKNLTDPVAMCDEKDIPLAEKSIIYILDRDAVEDFGHHPDYFTQDTILANYKHESEVLRSTFSAIRLISFPEPPPFVKKASYFTPITLGNGSSTIDEAMSEFLDTFKEFLHLLKGDIKEMQRHRPKGRFLHFKTFAKNASQLKTDDVRKSSEMFWQLIAMQASTEAYTKLIAHVIEIQDGDLQKNLQTLKQLQEEADQLLRERLQEKPDEFVAEEILKFHKLCQPQLEKKVEQLRLLAYEAMLVELCAAHKQQMKSLRGAVSEVQNVHSAFKAELKTKQREFKEAAFENHDLSQPAMTKLLRITRVQETKIEECLGSSRLIKIRVAFTDFAKQLARRGTENILKIAKVLDLCGNKKPELIHRSFNGELNRIKKEFKVKKDEILKANPSVHEELTINIIVEVYANEIFLPIQQAMAEATNLVNQRWKEHLTRKAKKSRFAEYLTLLLQDSAEPTANCTA